MDLGLGDLRHKSGPFAALDFSGSLALGFCWKVRLMATKSSPLGLIAGFIDRIQNDISIIFMNLKEVFLPQQPPPGTCCPTC